MNFLRIALVVLVLILLLRAVSRAMTSKADKENGKSEERDNEKRRKVADKTGEYVDYEEIDK